MDDASQQYDERENEEEELRRIERSGSESSSFSNSTSTDKKFKKFDWLNQHFTLVDKSAACNHCKQMFKNRHSTRLAGHVRKCRGDKSMEGLSVILEAGTNRDLNNLWTRTIIENNIPLRCVESDTFKQWVRKMNPEWKPPSRRELSSLYIPRLSRKLHQEFQIAAMCLHAPVLSIEFDHWQDANGRSFLGVIATRPEGERHLLDLRDVSARGHYASVIVEDLADILKHIPNHAINSIVSDSAASCKKARQDLVKFENYKHVIQHRCIAHLLNRLGQRITTKNETIAETIASASKITGFLSSSAYWQAAIQRLNHNKVKTACPTRWYSTVTMIESLLDLKSVILEEILPQVPQEKAMIIREVDWVKLRDVLEVLKPINKCIGFVEGKSVSIGEAFAFLLNYIRELFNPGEVCSDFKTTARAAFLWHFSPKRMDRNELGLYIAAYILDRRNQMKFISEDGMYLALEILALIMKPSAPLQRIKSSLIDEFDTYRNFREDYVIEDKDNNPVKWWSNRPSSMLMQVAIRLAHLKASSTNIERTFSTLRQIQGGSRINLSISSLVDICRLKIAKGVISEEDEDDYMSLDQEVPVISEATVSAQEHYELIDLSDEIESSEITDSQVMKDWLETQDLEIVASYKWFFKYVDFAVISERTSADDSQNLEISDEQIRELVRSSRDSQSFGIIYDSASQTAQYDRVFVVSDLESQ